MHPIVVSHIQAQIDMCRYAKETRQWNLKNKLKRNICALYPLRHMSSTELRAHLTKKWNTK